MYKNCLFCVGIFIHVPVFSFLTPYCCGHLILPFNVLYFQHFVSAFWLLHDSYLIMSSLIIQHCVWDKVFKNGPSNICGRQPLKNLKWYGLVRQNTLNTFTPLVRGRSWNAAILFVIISSVYVSILISHFYCFWHRFICLQNVSLASVSFQFLIHF